MLTRNLQNAYNTKIRTNNTSGVKGVSWHKKDKKWRVRVCVDGVNNFIGNFDDLELAELVAIEARDKYHGKFARL